jgi:hypothetical protein
MEFRSLLKWLPLAVVPATLVGGIAVAQQAQQVDLCYMKTSSGQTVSLQKLCEKLREAKEEQMEELEPKASGTSWVAVLGGTRPQRMPNGDVVYPDGTIKYADGKSAKIEIVNGLPVGIKIYDKDGRLLASSSASK